MCGIIVILQGCAAENYAFAAINCLGCYLRIMQDTSRMAQFVKRIHYGVHELISRQ